MNYPTFRNAEGYRNNLRDNDKLYDVVQIEDVIFTIDNYDLSGKRTSYGNKRRGLAMVVETDDRYESMEDAMVYIFYTDVFRDDITYID
jgi:predicted RNA-binding protein with PUA domain